MQRKTFLGATSAITIGIVAATIRKQEFQKSPRIRDNYTDFKNNSLNRFKLQFPKVYASSLTAKEIERSRKMTRELTYHFDMLKSMTSFGDFENEKVNDDNRLEYRDFLIYYDKERSNPLFSYEYITKNSIARKGSMSDNYFWLPDDRIKTNQNFESNDEYDKAHMAARKNHTKKDLDEAQTYFLTNSSPQNKSLNENIWKELDIFTRMLTEDEDYEGVHIFTGPAWDKTPVVTMPNTEIQIPSHFFKILVIESKTDPDMEKQLLDYQLFCFLIPNQKTPKKGTKQFYQYIGKYISTLDELEKVTQLGFKKQCKTLEWLPFS